MRTLALLICVGLGVQAQTRLSRSQMPDIVTPEEKWCPGPVLEVQTNRIDMILGKNWKGTSPCYIHFNITPPTKVDPVSVSTFLEPITIQVKAGFVGDDDVYIYATAPTFSGGGSTVATPSRIQISVKSLTAIQCPSCTGGVIPSPTTPRMFPANSVPVGFVAIRAGKFLPKADSILSHQQVFIGPGANMAIRYDQGGYWYEVGPAMQQAAALALRTSQLEDTRAQVAIRNMLAQPTPEKKVSDLEKQFEFLQNQLTELQARVPPTAEQTQQFRSEFNTATVELRDRMNEFIEANRYEAMYRQEVMYADLEKATKVDPPKSPDEKCDHPKTWAQDEKFIYRCLGITISDTRNVNRDRPTQQKEMNWVRFEYDRKWGKK